MSSMALDGATPRSRSTDPTTSVDAGRAAMLTDSQNAVLITLKSHGPLADHELVARVTAWSQLTRHRFSPQRIRTARAELAERGRVVLVEGEHRKTESGRDAQVWQTAEHAENTKKKES